MTGEGGNERHQLDRLAFFSDAVFAIAITLLIIEIHVPEVSHPTSETALANALLQLIPRYIGFVVSFVVIGRFWVGHHRAFGLLERVDAGLIWRNLLVLMVIAFMPFPTALVSEHLGTRVGTGVYTAWLTLAGLLNVVMIRHAMRGPLVAARVDEAVRRAVRRTAWSPVLIGGLAFGAAMIEPIAALLPLLLSPIILRLSRLGWTTKR